MEKTKTIIHSNTKITRNRWLYQSSMFSFASASEKLSELGE